MKDGRKNERKANKIEKRWKKKSHLFRRPRSNGSSV